MFNPYLCSQFGVMIDFKNAYFSYLSLQKVGHKVREEKNIFASQALEMDEKKEEDLFPFLTQPFKKSLDAHHFSHYTEKLEFNVVHQLVSEMFEENLDFINFSNEIHQHLYEKSLHPQIKSGELFIAYFENVIFGEITTQAIGIYKLENKKKYIRFDESKEIDYTIQKGYKLDKIDKAALIVNTQKDDGFIVFSVDDLQNESEYWKKNFLEILPVNDNRYQTKHYLQLMNHFAEEVVLDRNDKHAQANFLAQTINALTMNEFVSDELLQQTVLAPFELVDEYQKFKQQYAEDFKIDFESAFEVNKPLLIKESKKIKSEIKLDTNIHIKIDLMAVDAAEEYIEKGYDEEKRMFFYKVFYNSEQ